ncbi:MarR family transcriptional regulator [Leifsonia sp. H3M29-4]|uniref:MarR family winged helix-turn-helix transcriptional regulator n=1 Tax=Salinibacterium metalliresistens TaxID=3031321 RepID=UPI0023DC9D6B|nr:MarR family transcriptional regulator [Salinibacterium metalliresistens]MDF1477582.1 MarR family transcriptional regulator [Salinibacterium metalliresistens]
MSELTAAQQRAWRALVMATHRLDEALDRQSRRDGGIPHAYYKLLVFLYESGDRRLAMSQLAVQLGYSPSRLAHAVASLERSGWVRRVRSTEDRRVQFAELTAEGAGIVRAVTPGQVAEVREPVLKALSAADVAALERIATAITRALEA